MPARRDDKKLRQRIIDRAAVEFARHGFARASLRVICAGAKVNVAMVNYYFGGKAGLYREVIESAHYRLAATAPAQLLPTPGTPREMLRAFVAQMIGMVLRKGSADKLFARITMHELSNPSPVLPLIVRTLGRPVCEQLNAILAAVMKCPSNDPRVAAAVPLVLGMCMHFEHAQPLMDALGYPLPESPAEAKRFIERVTDFVEAGVLDLAFNGKSRPVGKESAA